MKEFIEFLGEQSPYDRLQDNDLAVLAQQVEVEYFPRGTVIVSESSPPLPVMYVLRTGSVEVLDRGRVTDILTVGDTFGHISLLAGLPPAMTVWAAEDTLCYRLPDPRGLLEQPEQLRFGHYGTMVARKRLVSAAGSLSQLERPLSTTMQPVLWCSATDTIRTVAAQMAETGHSCAVFIQQGDTGIVTENDFSRLVASGTTTIDAPVNEIASIPALSVPITMSTRSAYLHMVHHGVHHLLVDDTAGHPIGIIRVVDVSAAEIRDPLTIRSAIASAQTLDALKEAANLLRPTMIELWDAGVSAAHLGALWSTISETLLHRIVTMYSSGGTLSDLECSWVLLGSLGRGEPLPNSDVDTALVWRPVDPDQSVHKDDVLRAIMPIFDAMQACGLEPCSQGLNASSPLFCRSQKDWITTVRGWRRSPASSDSLLMTSTLLDGRAITSPRLTHRVNSELTLGEGRDALTKALTKQALTLRPPVGFVKGFVVGHFGEQKGHLNIKKSGLRPITTLARALSLRTGDTSGSTPERLDRAHQAGHLGPYEAESLKEAFQLCFDLTTDSQIRAIRANRSAQSVIAAADLSPMTRRYLRDTFRTIAQVQERFSNYYGDRL